MLNNILYKDIFFNELLQHVIMIHILNRRILSNVVLMNLSQAQVLLKFVYPLLLMHVCCKFVSYL